ncbi:MAG: hypothetical protein A2Z35_05960 [Actinobacteria bacterium RBG_19FT_COMBO_36_27]|nr:MAG: hypothetical protein A2Z35_05960 [Actinobacteria bacterium RBG_19FT_COMBO_36_27]
MRFYKIDLVEEGFNDKLTWRRFLVFIRGLPEDSSFNYFCKNKENRDFVEYDDEIIEKEIKRLK